MGTYERRQWQGTRELYHTRERPVTTPFYTVLCTIGQRPIQAAGTVLYRSLD